MESSATSEASSTPRLIGPGWRTIAPSLSLAARAASRPQCRAYSRALLEALPWQANSNDFVFDSQLLAQAIVARWRIGEVSVPTRYFPEASSIDLPRSIHYGLGVVATTLLAALARADLYVDPLFRTASSARRAP